MMADKIFQIIIDSFLLDSTISCSSFHHEVFLCPVIIFFYFSAKLVPLAFGIRKLSIVCVIEDDKVSLEDLEDKIVAFEDYVSIRFFFFFF